MRIEVDTEKKIQPSVFTGYGQVTIAQKEFKEIIGKTMKIKGTLEFTEVQT